MIEYPDLHHLQADLGVGSRSSQPTPAMRRADKRRALEACMFAQTWRTWPSGGNKHAGYNAAIKAVRATPGLTRFELAKVAIEAATRARK